MVLGRRRRSGNEFDDYYEDDQDSPDRQEVPRTSSPKRVVPLIVLALIGATFFGAIWVVAGRPMFEKTVLALISPVGLVWLGLFVIFYLSVLTRAKAPALIALLLWVLLSAAGNSLVSQQLARILEHRYENQNLGEMPKLDLIVLLGGGVGTAPNQQPQTGFSGDRLVQVARLYHQGKVETIVCCGTHGLPPYAGELTQAEAAFLLLTQLKIPESAIVQLDGTNTFQELQALDRWLSAQPNRIDLKVGIATSAWHLPRAMRLARTIGVDATPIATDFISHPFKREPGIVVPTARNLLNTHRTIKELIASWLGR